MPIRSWDALVAAPLDTVNAARLEAAIRVLDAHSQTLAEDAKSYWKVHQRRFAYIGELLLKRYANGRNGNRGPASILDVGQSYQTLLAATLFPESNLATLGFQDNRYKPQRAVDHITYDLNDAHVRTSWPTGKGFDLILFLEVIEHLYTSPRQTLGCLASLLNPGGAIMVSTPNAASLGHRISLLLGRQPFEMIRENRVGDPGHYREYTRKELVEIGRELNLRVEYAEMNNICLSPTTSVGKIYDRVTRLLPGTFRQMMTIVFSRQAA